MSELLPDEEIMLIAANMDDQGDERFSLEEVKAIVKAHEPLIRKSERQSVIEWLDDIFECPFYDAEKRDELCRVMWLALKKD